MAEGKIKIIAENRKARHEYFVLDTYEADGESYSIEYVPSSGSSYISETHTISYKDGLRYDKITIYHEGF